MFNMVPTSLTGRLFGYDPFREFDRFFAAPAVNTAGTFRTDIRHEEGEYIIDADLPGVAKEDIQLEVKDDTLTIKALRNATSEEKKDNYIRSERISGSFERSFDVSEIETDNITAAYENGVLTLHLPEKKVIEPETRKINIA